MRSRALELSERQLHLATDLFQDGSGLRLNLHQPLPREKGRPLATSTASSHSKATGNKEGVEARLGYRE